MIDIFEDNGHLLFRYESSGFYAVDPSSIDRNLKEKGEVTFNRIFTFEANAVLDDLDQHTFSEDTRTFVLGVDDGIFYRVDRKILGLKHDLRILKGMGIDKSTFVARRDISIFRKIDALIDEPIVIGGDSENAIPVEDFEELLRNFPTSTELTHYSGARITRVLKDYFGTISDAQKKLDDYLNKRKSIKLPSRVEFVREYEPLKFEYIREELSEMLKNADEYTEKDWQNLIVSFLLLIFPKYVAVLQKLRVKDSYSDPQKTKYREIDLTLVDANGSIDIVEIKKPFARCLLSTGKYRDNYTPKKELSGSVMQAEKYIFHLSKWGRDGELHIVQKRKSELPPDFEINITNPKAMILIGRDSDFTGQQKFDFEIIKRKYANIIDIITYDDLLRRLDNIISMIDSNYAKLGNGDKKT